MEGSGSNWGARWALKEGRVGGRQFQTVRRSGGHVSAMNRRISTVVRKVQIAAVILICSTSVSTLGAERGFAVGSRVGICGKKQADFSKSAWSSLGSRARLRLTATR